jgi:hypothetical protein
VQRNGRPPRLPSAPDGLQATTTRHNHCLAPASQSESVVRMTEHCCVSRQRLRNSHSSLLIRIMLDGPVPSVPHKKTRSIPVFSLRSTITALDPPTLKNTALRYQQHRLIQPWLGTKSRGKATLCRLQSSASLSFTSRWLCSSMQQVGGKARQSNAIGGKSAALHKINWCSINRCSGVNRVKSR